MAGARARRPAERLAAPAAWPARARAPAAGSILRTVAFQIMLWWPAQGECIPARAARAGRLAQVQFVVVFSSISFKKYCPPPLNCAIMLPPLCSPPKHAIMPVMLPPPHYAEIYASLGRHAQHIIMYNVLC